MSSFELDAILQELGQLGKFQVKNYILIAIPIALTACFSLNYIFTAGQLKYRCKIPECDLNFTSYNPDWLEFTVPFKDGTPSGCYRYESTIENPSCSPENFNNKTEILCNDFIYKGDEKTIVNEWNLTCDKNQWKITLVGTVQYFGEFICLIMTGYISDIYGRRTVFILGTIASATIGLIKSFSINYNMFIITEFLDPAIGSGLYSAGFVLVMELIHPSKRSIGGAMLCSTYPLGSMFLGITAMLTQDWRKLLRIIYPPAFIAIFYFFWINESIRWLVSKNRTKEATFIILNAAKMNKIQLSDSALDMIANISENKTDGEKSVSKAKDCSLKDVLKSRKLKIRIIICSLMWLVNTFVYFGLCLNSVNLAGNKYFNFCLVSMIEMPAILFNGYFSSRVGRRWSLFGAMLLCGFSCISSVFMTNELAWLKLILIMVGKFGISMSFSLLYVYTTELFPTSLRNRLLGICSLFGRMGSMLAPQTPLLVKYYEQLPILIFGGIAACTAIMALQLPETSNVTLPDTIEEAENVNKK